MGARIEVMVKGSLNSDRDANNLVSRLPIKVYNINDDFGEEDIRTIEGILSDPISEVVSSNQPILSQLPLISSVIEQTPKPGVTDSEGDEARKIIGRALGREIGPVSLSHQHL